MEEVKLLIIWFLWSEQRSIYINVHTILNETGCLRKHRWIEALSFTTETTFILVNQREDVNPREEMNQRRAVNQWEEATQTEELK